mmetsp:Transcript_18894/g.23037  ORF Transcript_18894/g.23037 Transcript_18894/m.23037 type:complete len:88 (-) Transcript_18894:396-659(-)
MTNTPETLEASIRAGISNISHLDVHDLSDGCGEKFGIVCVSESFNGVSLLERHRIVHNSIEKHMKTIHAIELKTWTPKQFEKKKLAQ